MATDDELMAPHLPYLTFIQVQCHERKVRCCKKQMWSLWKKLLLWEVLGANNDASR